MGSITCWVQFHAYKKLGVLCEIADNKIQSFLRKSIHLALYVNIEASRAVGYSYTGQMPLTNQIVGGHIPPNKYAPDEFRNIVC